MLLTGHKSRAIFDRYNIINEQELLEASDQLVAYLAQHAPATPGVVERIVTDPHDAQSTGSSPADAIRHWSAELGHPIEDLTAEDDLTPLPGPMSQSNSKPSIAKPTTKPCIHSCEEPCSIGFV